MPMLKYLPFVFLSVFAAVLAAKEQIEVYKYLKTDGTMAFSDQKPQNLPFETLKFDCYACQVSSNIDWHKTPLYNDKYKVEISAASQTHNIDQALIRAVIHAESWFQPDATSKVGAAGLMQLMPETANSLGVLDPYQVRQNINGGAQYLARLLKSYHGDITLATAAYNSGPSTIEKYNGVPPYPETKAYVERVKILHRRYRM